MTQPGGTLFVVVLLPLEDLLAFNDDQFKFEAAFPGTFAPDAGAVGGVVIENDFSTAFGIRAFRPDSFRGDFRGIQNRPPPKTAPAWATFSSGVSMTGMA